MSKVEWLTPPDIIKSLGKFDLDPCSPIIRPWPTAKKHYTVEDDGLFLPWEGRVWLNPPYGKQEPEWLRKMAIHGKGISFVFAKTDTNMWHNYVFPVAVSLFFIKQRVFFHNVDGTIGQEGSEKPSVLISYSEYDADKIADSKAIVGRHILINAAPLVVVNFSSTWKVTVDICITRLNGKAELAAIYKMVEEYAPEKVEKNQHYKAKVRQVLQEHFIKIKKGCYATSTTII